MGSKDINNGQAGKVATGSTFVFRDIVAVVKYTGFKAATLVELRDAIGKISKDSLFHHTCRYYLKGNVQEHTNDFAHWAGVDLEEGALAEQLSNIDPYSFETMDGLREHFLLIIDEYLNDAPEPTPVRPGEEFFFSEAAVFVLPSGTKVKNLAEFLMAIKYIDASSIYYHFYEARARLGAGVDDFSMWIEGSLDLPDIAEKLRLIDPFMNNLEDIRLKIIDVLEGCIRREMEGVSC